MELFEALALPLSTNHSSPGEVQVHEAEAGHGAEAAEAGEGGGAADLGEAGSVAPLGPGGADLVSLGGQVS